MTHRPDPLSYSNVCECGNQYRLRRHLWRHIIKATWFNLTNGGWPTTTHRPRSDTEAPSGE